jgi:hypothetical protein
VTGPSLFDAEPVTGRPLRVLVACEFSGAVRDAFIARGHFARSVDLLPTESLPQRVTFRGDFGCYDHPAYDPSCDACECDEPWCHRHGMHAYECPCLGPTEDEAVYADSCEMGARHLAGDLFTVEDIEGYDLLIAHPPCTRLTNSGVRWLDERNLWAEMFEAADFFRRILELPVPRIAVENPIPHRYALERIGRKYDQIIQPWQFGHGETKATCLWLKNLPKLQPTNVVSGREARIHKLPPSADRWKLRSVTYQGIADAMAAQWGAQAAQAVAA